MKNSKTPIPVKLKQRLYPAVLDLFSQKDFHQVQIREICKLSGLSPSTIYRYFSSKEDLLFSILDEKIGEIAERIIEHIKGLESTREIFRKIIWVTMHYYDQNPGVAITAFITVPTRSWMREPSYVNNDVLKVLSDIIEYGKDRKEIDPSLEHAQIRDLFYMYCSRQIHLWYYHGRKWRLVDTVPRFFPLFWKTVTIHDAK